MEKNSTATDTLLKNLQEREREQSLIFSVSAALAPVTDLAGFSEVISRQLRELLNFDNMVICTTDEKEQEYYIFYQYLSTSPVSKHTPPVGYAATDGFFGACIGSAENVVFDLSALAKKQVPDYIQKIYAAGMRHCIGVPLPQQKKQPAVMLLFFKKPDSLSRPAMRLLKGIPLQLSITLLNITRTQDWERMEQELAALRKRPDVQQPEAVKEVGADKSFFGIIGQCAAMQKVFEHIAQVASSETNVLITGETGTGKELIASAIHDNSAFSKKAMIKVNCAAIPANLIESELFGHEKGSFTGAAERRTGKFELAHNSTIFLDEIGELPLELQAKMLRVLQEREIERIGGSTTIKVNVRIIAATNRDLQDEVTAGRFRADLYYRLNVYPVSLPALRERMEDLPLLSDYFLSHHAAKAQKKAVKFSYKAMQAMQAYHWPGNVRELGNIIERSVLFAKGDTVKEIHFTPVNISPDKNTADEFTVQTLQEVEKEHILKVINKCNGRISGAYGAAVLLGIPATTLISKMQKLGIKKGFLTK